MAPFHLPRLFTRGGWVVKKGQNSVYVVIEWPLRSYETAVEHVYEIDGLFSLTEIVY